MRFCFSASGVTDEQVADRPSDEQSEERRVNPLLYAVAVWGRYKTANAADQIRPTS